MLRAVLLLLATSEVAAIADDATGETFCAEIVSEKSSAYEQSSDNWRFSFTFKVQRWVPKMHISIAFGEPVEITQVSGGASEVDQRQHYGQGAPSRLKPPPVPTAHPARAASCSGREFRRGRAGRRSSQLGFRVSGDGLGDQQHEPGNHVHVR